MLRLVSINSGKTDVAQASFVCVNVSLSLLHGQLNPLPFDGREGYCLILWACLIKKILVVLNMIVDCSH